MKKNLSKKKLQLRSTTIATLSGPALRIVKGGTNDGVDDGGTAIGTGGSDYCASIKSIMDETRPLHCNVPITEG